MGDMHSANVEVESPEVSGASVDLSVLDLGSHARRWAGGFADVYVAVHPQLGALALKRPRGACKAGSSEYRHLEKEAKIWKGLIHPNVLRFIAISERDGAIYLVSPLLQNGTVPQYVAEYPDAPRASFIQDLAKGLDYLHQRGVVHGDIKGSNLLVSSSTPVQGVVADFGLAKLVDDQTVSSQKGAGTPRWQSPELLSGGSRTYKSDVYAFGMTVYEIISGKAPFDGVPIFTLFFKIYNKERPAQLPQVSPLGYSYAREWQAARAAWEHSAESRPSMDRIIRFLESPSVPQRLVKARIKVICDKMPERTGYVSRTLHSEWGQQVVTQEVGNALIVAYDLEYLGPQAIRMLAIHLISTLG